MGEVGQLNDPSKSSAPWGMMGVEAHLVVKNTFLDFSPVHGPAPLLVHGAKYRALHRSGAVGDIGAACPSPLQLRSGGEPQP